MLYWHDMRRLFGRYIVIANLCIAVFSLAGTQAWSTEQQTYLSQHQDRVNRLLAGLSLREKVGQMIMSSILGKQISPDLQRFLNDIKPGGITIFGYNIKSPTQLRRLNRSLFVTVSPIKPFLAIDQEGGVVVRLIDDISDIPGNMALGAARSPRLSYHAGRILAEGLTAYGFNMDLAPVLDINTNPKNPVIGIRSFASDPNLVGELGTAFITGMQSKGVVAVGKHFPGHGDTESDSHTSLPVLKYNGKRLRERELIPFQKAIRNGKLNVIMTAHIALPGLHKGKLVPATLSKLVLTNILRKEMRYEGIIMTDGLEMRGLISVAGTISRASVRAIQAGADMISINADPAAVYQARNAILRAVRKGKIPVSRINASVKRILLVKAHYGILDRQSRIKKPSAKQQKHYQQTAYDLALKSATLIKNNNNLLPIVSGKYRRVLVIGPGKFNKRFSQGAKDIRLSTVRLTRKSTEKTVVRRALKAMTHKPDVIVIALSSSKQIGVVKSIAKQFNRPIVLVSLGSPYLLQQYRQAAAFLGLYSSRKPAQLAAADIVLGRQNPTGKLPVAIPGMYPYGHSLTYKESRLDRRALSLSEDPTTYHQRQN